MIEVEAFQPGKYVQSGKFRCFVPSRVNAEWEWKSQKINKLLESASNKLGELKGLSRLVPDVSLFIFLSASAEATASSRIEGTQTELDEAVSPEDEVRPERRDDWREVQNYIAALRDARENEPVLPVSSRVICRAHEILMRGVRGKNKAPGEFRKIQNWLGNTPTSPEFVPPPASDVGALMSDLEKFLHNERIATPVLVRAAIAHYQFETIHPFLDGNGRIGRLIVPLYLAETEMTDKPLLYISRYLAKNKLRYYDNLTRARAGDMARWLEFFLLGVGNAADESADALTATIEIKNTATEKIRKTFKRSGKGLALLDYLFAHPIIGVDDAARECRIAYPSANELVGKMVQMNLLREETGQRRNRRFVFREYLDIFDR